METPNAGYSGRTTRALTPEGIVYGDPGASTALVVVTVKTCSLVPPAAKRWLLLSQ